MSESFTGNIFKQSLTQVAAPAHIHALLPLPHPLHFLSSTKQPPHYLLLRCHRRHPFSPLLGIPDLATPPTSTPGKGGRSPLTNPDPRSLSRSSPGIPPVNTCACPSGARWRCSPVTTSRSAAQSATAVLSVKSRRVWARRRLGWAAPALGPWEVRRALLFWVFCFGLGGTSAWWEVRRAVILFHEVLGGRYVVCGFFGDVLLYEVFFWVRRHQCAVMFCSSALWFLRLGPGRPTPSPPLTGLHADSALNPPPPPPPCFSFQAWTRTPHWLCTSR